MYTLVRCKRLETVHAPRVAREHGIEVIIGHAELGQRDDREVERERVRGGGRVVRSGHVRPARAGDQSTDTERVESRLEEELASRQRLHLIVADGRALRPSADKRAGATHLDVALERDQGR